MSSSMRCVMSALIPCARAALPRRWRVMSRHHGRSERETIVCRTAALASDSSLTTLIEFTLLFQKNLRDRSR